jgi:hypothetical protein
VVIQRQRVLISTIVRKVASSSREVMVLLQHTTDVGIEVLATAADRRAVATLQT